MSIFDKYLCYERKNCVLRRYNFRGSDSIDLGYKNEVRTWITLPGISAVNLFRACWTTAFGKSYILRQIAGELIDSGRNSEQHSLYQQRVYRS